MKGIGDSRGFANTHEGNLFLTNVIETKIFKMQEVDKGHQA